jgi:hypothetical protein
MAAMAAPVDLVHMEVHMDLLLLLQVNPVEEVVLGVVAVRVDVEEMPLIIVLVAAAVVEQVEQEPSVVVVVDLVEEELVTPVK